MTVSVGIIGLGIMGRRMLEHMVLHGKYRPVAMWDPSVEACRAVEEIAPEARLTASAKETIAAADLVYLACPPGPRSAYALEAAAAGKAVFLEKPLGVDIANSRELVAGLAAHGTPAAVNFTQAAGAAMTAVQKAAQNGELGEVVGADIVVTYSAWPRAWQKQADWLRFRAEGGMTREVVSHFLFFSERILGPLSVVWAHPSYPQDPGLCETHLLARLETVDGRPVSIFASVEGAQPDRQELTIKGTATSRRINDFYIDTISNGGPFVEISEKPVDPRAASLKAQLDDLLLCIQGKPNRLATPEEALRVQILVETMLRDKIAVYSHCGEGAV
jgi:predicted dehydrogenase